MALPAKSMRAAGIRSPWVPLADVFVLLGALPAAEEPAEGLVWLALPVLWTDPVIVTDAEPDTEPDAETADYRT